MKQKLDRETRAILRAQRLRARWNKRDNDLWFYYPSKPDGHLLHSTLSAKHIRVGSAYPHEWDDSFVEELKQRGYDITTLKFSVQRDPYWLAARAIGNFLQWAADQPVRP